MAEVEDQAYFCSMCAFNTFSSEHLLKHTIRDHKNDPNSVSIVHYVEHRLKSGIIFKDTFEENMQKNTTATTFFAQALKTMATTILNKKSPTIYLSYVM